jgi:hypothetical protein
MLSHAGRSIGAGWTFGLNEALDQVGATIGPLFVALILFSKADTEPVSACCSFQRSFVSTLWWRRDSSTLAPTN